MFLKLFRIALLGFGLFCSQFLYANPKLQQAQALLEQSKLQESLDLTNEILAEDSDNIEARFMKGLILTRYDRLPEAETVFDELTRDHPGLPEPYNNLAVVYAAQGKFEEARDALSRAINTHPSYATAHENLGDIYAKMASRAYNQALELDDGNVAAREKLALVKEVFSATGYRRDVESEAQPKPVAVVKKEPVVEQVKQVAATSNLQPKPVVSAELGSQDTITQAQDTTTLPPATSSIEIDPVITSTITDWSEAWSSQSVDSYLYYYSNDFKPESGLSFDKWKQQRQVRLKKPKFIDIKIDNVRVDMISEDIALASFEQTYASDTYHDTVKKKLRLQKQQDQWKIVKEFSN